MICYDQLLFLPFSSLIFSHGYTSVLCNKKLTEWYNIVWMKVFCFTLKHYLPLLFFDFIDNFSLQKELYNDIYTVILFIYFLEAQPYLSLPYYVGLMILRHIFYSWCFSINFPKSCNRHKIHIFCFYWVNITFYRYYTSIASFSLQLLLQDYKGLPQLILKSPELFLPQIWIFSCFSLELNKKAKFPQIFVRVTLVLFWQL